MKPVGGNVFVLLAATFVLMKNFFPSSFIT